MDRERPIRVLIVDDHPVYVVGLRMALRYSNSGCEVVGEMPNVRQAVAYLEAHGKDIDLVLLDYFLSDGTGMDVLRVVHTICPQVKVLLISGGVLDQDIIGTVEGYIDGFVSKNVNPDELKMRIDAIFRHQSWRNRKSEENDKDVLSPRELEIIRFCAQGKSAREVAESLNLSRRTVEAHKNRIFSKLNCKSTAELVNYAFRNGLA